MKKIKVLDKEFEVSITNREIIDAIDKMAKKIDNDLKGKDVIFMGILNGSFMFAGDLFKKITIDCQITFLKLASYQGTSSSGNVKRLIGINEDIKDKTVVILEDIVDTGITLDNIKKQLIGYEPEQIKIATLLFKPDAYQKNIEIDYIGLSIPNDFIVGYGLDYDGYGRNLADIYTLIK
ncbi:MAG: hypoxanthine phosphoribosyltransferase [Bacteroidales bacterium]|nr:hypoxanthine phosphoribosyltransferase [Bacteroidales bacterium]